MLMIRGAYMEYHKPTFDAYLWRVALRHAFNLKHKVEIFTENLSHIICPYRKDIHLVYK